MTGTSTYKNKQTFQCEVCGANFTSSPRAEAQKVVSGCCSQTCRSQKVKMVNKTRTVICEQCGQPFEVADNATQQARKVCSRACQNAAQSKKTPKGAEHWNWNNGSTPFLLKVRSTSIAVQWAHDVKARDNDTCVICGKAGEEAHHIKAFAQIVRENNITTVEEAKQCAALFDINNGITVCHECHRTFHPWL